MAVLSHRGPARSDQVDQWRSQPCGATTVLPGDSGEGMAPGVPSRLYILWLCFILLSFSEMELGKGSMGLVQAVCLSPTRPELMYFVMKRI